MSLATFTTWIYLAELSSFQFTVSCIFTSSPHSCFSKICDSCVDLLQTAHRQFLLRRISWAPEAVSQSRTCRRWMPLSLTLQDSTPGQLVFPQRAGILLYFSGSQRGELAPRRHLAMSGDIFSCRNC